MSNNLLHVLQVELSDRSYPERESLGEFAWIDNAMSLGQVVIELLEVPVGVVRLHEGGDDGSLDLLVDVGLEA